jgi:hypothetical protein
VQVLFTEMAENCLKEIESLALNNHPTEVVYAFVDGLIERILQRLQMIQMFIITTPPCSILV